MNKLIAVALMAFALGASAEEVPVESVTPTFELATPNDMSGQVILSFTDCDLKQDFPVKDKLFNARAVIFAGTDKEKVFYGCWYYALPPQNLPNAIPIVNIFTEDGQAFSAPASDFKPYKAVQPEV
jgi:hypothetical protein